MKRKNPLAIFGRKEASPATSNLEIINSLCNSFSLYSQAEGEPTKMTYYEPSEWDEDSVEVERYEEEAGESVLRSERDLVLSRMNHGIQQVHLELNNLL